jgi:hypothetical protein
MLFSQCLDTRGAFEMRDLGPERAEIGFAFVDVVLQLAHMRFSARGVGLGLVQADGEHDDEHAGCNLRVAD